MRKLLLTLCTIVLAAAALCVPVSQASSLIPTPPVYMASLGGAYLAESALVAAPQGPSLPGARVNYPMYFGGSSSPFRYSGSETDCGHPLVSNSVKIALGSGSTLANADNHLAAWEGVNACSAANWVQAGVIKGRGCYGFDTGGSQYSYLELNAGAATDPSGACPTGGNGNGYLITGVAVGTGSTHTVVAYLCASTSGCSYYDPCTGFYLSSSYHRGAISFDGCMQASNVLLGDPYADTRQTQAPLEDGFAAAHGDHGSATFRSSTNAMAFFETPGGNGCGGVYSGNKAWDGCLNPN